MRLTMAHKFELSNACDTILFFSFFCLCILLGDFAIFSEHYHIALTAG